MNQPDTDFEWVWNDPNHLGAHRRDFIVDPETVLARVRDEVGAAMPEEAAVCDAAARQQELWFHRDFEFPEPVGWTGLRDICESKAGSFWGFRTGRSIPSHLCLGQKDRTRWVCLWGRWEPGRFVIHTMYPGRVAPREIHDPALPLAELPAAIAFWACHAIVVGEDEYTVVFDSDSPNP